jgi:hypothetical protein
MQSIVGHSGLKYMGACINEVVSKCVRVIEKTTDQKAFM